VVSDVVEFGYKLSSEEHNATDLVRYARRAEEMGFTFAAISDHYHPWVDKQGNSPFVWSVLGAAGEATERLQFLTGVTCPTIRTHPAIIAQAAATTAQLLPGRFSLGLGSGENLNEHILGDRWPPAVMRLEMLDEAIDVIRLLWEGGLKTHRGTHYTVENARIYTLPDELPPILVAGSGEHAVNLAAEKADGFIGLAPDAEIVKNYKSQGGEGNPLYAEINVCWASDSDDAKKIVCEWWPVTGLKGQLMQELALPSHFQQAVETVTPEDAIETVAIGPDPEIHIDNIQKFIDAGYTHLWIHQIGPEQDNFFDFYAKEVLPNL
jgi:coenzyme F420-dependent glucose-6-phosphate dehydrogenase